MSLRVKVPELVQVLTEVLLDETAIFVPPHPAPLPSIVIVPEFETLPERVTVPEPVSVQVPEAPTVTVPEVRL